MIQKEAKIKTGVTTGSLATATALASLQKVLNQKLNIKNVDIITPIKNIKHIIKSVSYFQE